MMNDILNYMLESFLIFSIFLMFYHLFLEKEKCYHFNRFYLLITPLLALILPMIHIQVNPASPVAGVVFPDDLIILPEISITAGITVEESSSYINWNLIIIGSYLIGFTFFLARFLSRLGQIGLMFLKYRNKFIKLNGYYLVHTLGEIPTFSFINYIFWDQTRSLTEDEEKQILEHELKHIRDVHFLDLIYFNILSIVFWFNPFTHLLLIKAGEIHEYIADDTVVRRVDRADYVSLLARMALFRIHLPVSSFFNRSTTLKRIEKMKSNKRNTSILKLLAIIPVIGIIFLVFACQDETSRNMDAKSIQVVTEQSDIDSGSSARIDERNEALPDIPDDEILDHKLDIDPAPIDGMEAFYKAIQMELQYPLEAKEKGIEGKVFVQFVIDKEGRIRNVTTLKGISHGCDEEAERVLETIDVKWTPGVYEDVKVNCQMILPITFKLS
ncbi:TonB family protein [Bacteroidota bacterium]